MSEAECICYHMGHGAMYCVTVYEDSTKNFVKKRFLIDAGSNQDCSEQFAEENIDEIIDLLSKTIDEEWIFCLTHLHKDHYSAFETICDSVDNIGGKVDRFYIGSLTEREWIDITDDALKDYDEYSEGKQAVQKILKKLTGKVIFMGNITESEKLWEDDDVTLYLLFNCMFKLDNLKDAKQAFNSNCASFLVKHNKHKSAFWFTGDITGATFDNILYHEETLESMKAILSDCVEVVMTPPHHGSIHSLQEMGFIQEDLEDSSEKWSPFNWKFFCIKIGLIRPKSEPICKLVWSTCLLDKYNHPDGVALAIYSTVCRKATNKYEWTVYRTYDSEPDCLFCGEYKEDNDEYDWDDQEWYVQNLPHVIRPTVEIDSNSREIKWYSIAYHFEEQ